VCSLARTKSRNLAELEQALGCGVVRPELLEQALTHSSQARELEGSTAEPQQRFGDNEQLEFLGDAVLGLITSEDLFHRFPQFREGELSKMRAHLVSEKHLIQVARRLELGHYLQLGRGEEKSGGRNKTTLLVDALEAVLGAIYIDGGLEKVRPVVLEHIILPELARIAQDGRSLPLTDYKSALQEKLQALGRPQPSYVLVKEQGPQHRKTFTVEARLQAVGEKRDFEFVGRSEGSTKKTAEQGAARQLLDYLVSLPSPAAKRPGGRRAAATEL
jgi:ribonuclease III